MSHIIWLSCCTAVAFFAWRDGRKVGRAEARS